LTNHLIAVRGFAAVPAFTAVFWSLAVEEQFYLVWPTVVRHMQREYLLWFAYAAIVVAFCFRVWIHFSGTWSPDAAYVLTLARMDALAVGAVIAMLVRRPDAVVRLRRWLPWTALASVVALLAVGIARGGFYSWDPFVQIFGLSATALAFGTLLTSSVVSRGDSRWNRILSARWLRAFGKYSYGMYVLHSPVNWIGEHFYQRYHPPQVFGSAIPGGVSYMMVGFAASFGVAWASWRFLESSFLSLKRYFPVHTMPALGAADTAAMNAEA
jgi:peptidoglycan/LPS O-acetylase OafA/YrhL